MGWELIKRTVKAGFLHINQLDNTKTDNKQDTVFLLILI